MQSMRAPSFILPSAFFSSDFNRKLACTTDRTHRSSGRGRKRRRREHYSRERGGDGLRRDAERTSNPEGDGSEQAEEAAGGRGGAAHRDVTHRVGHFEENAGKRKRGREERRTRGGITKRKMKSEAFFFLSFFDSLLFLYFRLCSSKIKKLTRFFFAGNSRGCRVFGGGGGGAARARRGSSTRAFGPERARGCCCLFFCAFAFALFPLFLSLSLPFTGFPREI